MFGSDDRIQIANTKIYPFSAIGYLESKDLKGDYESCSATLIGPTTVLTAAHCLYNHEAGGWQEDMFFVPGLNGATADDAPFGGYEYDSRLCRSGLHRQLPGLLRLGDAVGSRHHHAEAADRRQSRLAGLQQL